MNLPSCSTGQFFSGMLWGFGAPKRTVSDNTHAHFLHTSCRCVREMQLIFSSVCFFIGFAAYFRFMGIMLHCMGSKSVCEYSHAHAKVLGSESICDVHVCKKTCVWKWSSFDSWSRHYLKQRRTNLFLPHPKVKYCILSVLGEGFHVTLLEVSGIGSGWRKAWDVSFAVCFHTVNVILFCLCLSSCSH